jgi:hypothetical protein
MVKNEIFLEIQQKLNQFIVLVNLDEHIVIDEDVKLY